MRGIRRLGVVAFSFVALALVGGPLALTARAAEEPPPDPSVAKVTDFEARVQRHIAEKAAAALVQDAKEAIAIHKEVAEKPPLKKRVLAAFSTLVKSVKEDGEKKAILGSLGQTGDPDAAPIVKPFLRQGNVEEADELLLGAIVVAGQVPGKETVEPLLTIVEKSKHMGASSKAMEALGSFGKVKPHRERILETLVKIVQPLQPGGPPRRGGQSGGVGEPADNTPPSGQGPSYNNPNNSSPAAKWAAFAPILPTTLNKLTGQNCASVDQWFTLVKQAKPNTGSLFHDA